MWAPRTWWRCTRRRTPDVPHGRAVCRPWAPPEAALKSLPDVLWMRTDRISPYGSSGALLDLSPYLGRGIDTGALGASAVTDGKVASLDVRQVGLVRGRQVRR